MKTYVKICGITCASYAEASALAGADYIGVIIDIEESPRSVPVEKAQQIIRTSRLPVIVLMEKDIQSTIDEAKTLAPHGIQLIGHYSPEDVKRIKKKTGCKVWKSLSIPETGLSRKACTSLLSLINDFKNAGANAIILDTLIVNKKGGTGRTCDWDAAERITKACGLPIFLAGGIHPGNVCDAIKKVMPYGIDLSSGVEKSPGEKDPAKILELVNNINAIQ